MRLRALPSLMILLSSSAALAQPDVPVGPDAAQVPAEEPEVAGPPEPRAAPPQAAPPQAAPPQMAPAPVAPTYAMPGPSARPGFDGIRPAPWTIPLRPRQPSVLGVSLGVLQTSQEAMADVDPRGTTSLFGRVGLSRRWSLQVELGKTRNDDATIYTGTTSLAIALGSSQRLVPMVRGGAGLDLASGTYGTGGFHAEAAFVLEARFPGGFVLGGEFALGARAAASHRTCYYDAGYPLLPGDDVCGGPLDNTTYRAAKLTLGIAL
jgi:hypothetical protein